MRYLFLLLCLSLFNCDNNPIASDEFEPTIEIVANLEQDVNGYYHLEVIRSEQQTLHRISLETNFEESIRVEWSADKTWTLDPDGNVLPPIDGIWPPEVPIINSVSYTSPDDGTAQTMFAPVVELVGDTVIVFVSSGDATDQIKIILD